MQLRMHAGLAEEPHSAGAFGADQQQAKRGPISSTQMICLSSNDGLNPYALFEYKELAQLASKLTYNTCWAATVSQCNTH